MKTALRTYHPVPSLQGDEASRKDMQDAPRIKGILKACFLDWEVMDQPTVLKDVAVKSVRSVSRFQNSSGTELLYSELSGTHPWTPDDGRHGHLPRLRRGGRAALPQSPSDPELIRTLLQWISEKYFPPGFDLYDLFYPSECVWPRPAAAAQPTNTRSTACPRLLVQPPSSPLSTTFLKTSPS